MKKFTKSIAISLASVLIVSAFLTGCNSNEGKTASKPATESNTSGTNNTPADPYAEEIAKGAVELIMWQIGEGANDQPKSIAAINEKMSKEINTTLDMRYAPWADWQTKYQLLFNSGEQFDAAFTSSWADYGNLLKKGGFYELTEEAVKTYAPNYSTQLFDETHKYLWEDSAIEGKRCIIPQIYDWKNNYVVMIRGDLREKYNIPEIKSLDDVINYAIAIGNKEKGLVPYNDVGSEKHCNAFFMSQNWDGAGVPALSLDKLKNDGKVFSIFDAPETVEWAKRMREMQVAGAYSKSALSNKTSSLDNFKAGKSAIILDGFGGPIGTYMEIIKSNPEFKPEIYDFAPDAINAQSLPTDGGMSIYAESKNPIRAIMAIDLLMGVREYNDLLALGVPGTHWNPVGDDKYELLEAGVANFTPYAACPWGLNTNFMRVDKDTPDFAGEFRANWAKNIKPSIKDGFAFKDDSVKNEITAITATYLAEMPAIAYGLHENPEKAISDLGAKLVKLGLDKVKTEMQTQLDAYISSK